MAFIITGACGVGKTAILPFIKANLPQFNIHDFDEVGVPSYPSRKWRKETTKRWVDLSVVNLKSKIPTIILGVIVPQDVAEFVPKDLAKKFRFLLLAVSLEERERRFKCRNEQRETILKERINFDNLRSWLETSSFQYEVLDTTHLKIEETAGWVVDWIKSEWERGL